MVVWPRVPCMLAAVFLGMLVSAASIAAGNEIKEMNVHTIADVLNQVPGIKAGDSSARE